jgi:zinc transporter ZupT
MQWFLLGATLFATAIAVGGSVLGTALGGVSQKRLELLIHVATGALLGITAFDILPEAKSVLPWSTFLVATVIGYLLLWVVGRFVFFVCPSCAIAHVDDNSMARRGSLILLASALGIHCLLDGVAIVTGGHLSNKAEIGAFLAVALHKLPEGLALGLLLAGARYRRSTSIWMATAIESLTVVGGGLGLLVVLKPTPATVGMIFALVGGGFVYLVANAFEGALSHAVQLPRSRWMTAQLASFVATGALFWFANSL